MAKIDSLNESISSMEFQEAFNLVKVLRESRRTKKTTRVSVRRSSSKTTTPKKPKDLVSLLTPEQKELLIKELTGG